MDWSTFSNILISATFFAALIAAMTNVIIAIMNNQRLKNIESKKYSSEMKSALLRELIALHKEWIEALHNVEYSGTPVWENSLTRFDTNVLFLKKMRVLINNDIFWKSIDDKVDSKETKEIHLAVLKAVRDNIDDEKQKNDDAKAFLLFFKITAKLESEIDETFKMEIRKILGEM